MSDMSDTCKIWTRFVSKKTDGSVIKLRIQGCPMEPGNDFFEFIMKYFVCSEAVHNASGIYKSEEATQEYRDLLSHFFKIVPLHGTVCCVDDDLNSIGQILGASFVQLTKSSDKLEDMIKGMDFKTEELHKLLYAGKVLQGYTEGKTDCEVFYYGRGIIVNPDYRGLGIANELVKVRKLICIANGIPMTCAWMSALGSQRAAHNNNWKVLVEVPLEELEDRTELTFENRPPSFKFMYTTAD